MSDALTWKCGHSIQIVIQMDSNIELQQTIFIVDQQFRNLSVCELIEI